MTLPVVANEFVVIISPIAKIIRSIKRLTSLFCNKAPKECFAPEGA